MGSVPFRNTFYLCSHPQQQREALTVLDWCTCPLSVVVFATTHAGATKSASLSFETKTVGANKMNNLISYAHLCNVKLLAIIILTTLKEIDKS